MATYSKHLLSGSTGGTAILLDAAPTATTIHTTGTSDTVLDEIWIYAHNISESDATLTIRYGNSVVDNEIIVTVTSKAGLMLAVPGLILSGDGASTRTVAAFSSASGSINLTGYVNRIS